MDLESECSVLESVEDNEEIRNVSVSEELGNIGEYEVLNNGFCVVEENDNNELLSNAKGKGTEVGPVSSPPLEMKSEVSSSPTATRKGHGLRKWRRFKRDVSKGGDNSVDNGKMVMPDLSNSGVNPSKRTQVYTERGQKSEGSVSSTNAVVRSLDVFPLLGESVLCRGPLFDAGTDSENSEDRSSKSSTAASFPKNYETPVIVGFPHDKSRMRSLSGKNLTHTVQRGQQGKNRIESIKKARGEWVKIEKENSRSSMESDSRSSNFIFMQGTYATSNGTRSEGPIDYDGENGDEVQGSEQKVRDGLQRGYGRDGLGGYEDILPEDVVAGSSWEVKEERSHNHGSSPDQDPLAESILVLQSAQEALEKEVLKFKEMSRHVSVDDSVSEFTEVEQEIQETSSEQFPSGEGLQSFSRAVKSEVIETTSRVVETELEDLFKQKIEAEVEYLAISRMVQMLRVAAVDKITIMEKQKPLASEQTQTINKLGDTDNNAAVLEKEVEKSEIFCEEIESAGEALKLKKRVCKYTSYLFVQLVSLVLILGVFTFQLSPNYVEVVPT